MIQSHSMSTSSPRHSLIELKIEACSELEGPKLAHALQTMAKNDPNLTVRIDPESGERLVGGQSEQQLDGVLHQLKQQGITINIGSPQVAYRETITRSVTKDYTHKKQMGGAGQYARLILEIRPNARDAGISIISILVDSSIPNKFIPGIEKGINSVLTSGPIAGFPIVDLELILTDGAYHDTDSFLIAFEIAARAALREAFDAAGAVILEPIMKVDLTLPEQFIGSIIDDLKSRNGKVVAVTEDSKMITISALVPFANLFGYQASLKTLSSGHATFKMAYSHYQTVSPPSGPDNFPPAIGMRI